VVVGDCRRFVFAFIMSGEFVRTVSGKMEGGGEVMIEADDVPMAAAEDNDYSSPEADEVFGNQQQHHTTTTAAMMAPPLAGNVIDEIPEEQEDDDAEEDDDEDEESLEDDYEYEDEDDAAVSGFLVDNPAAAIATIGSEKVKAPTKIEEENDTNNNSNNSTTTTNGNGKPKWRQPTAAAVNMSLRAETETSGGKRRLAQDLFRIMNQDTEDAGFSLRPSNEDSMDKWTIQLFQFDNESNLAKDMKVLGLTNVELEMSFPDQYPFEPPFVRVLRPRFKRQTGFVMNGALCMELLTKVRPFYLILVVGPTWKEKARLGVRANIPPWRSRLIICTISFSGKLQDGWNPINDIESVIVSIRSLLVVGDGRLEAAAKLSEAQYQKLLKEADLAMAADTAAAKRQKTDSPIRRSSSNNASANNCVAAAAGGSYSVTEAKAAYDHLSDYHKKKGWDTSGWWAKKG
jgi:ubiquitin-conjugating enzyme E2 Q